jgi:hypothetical protein
MSEDTQNSIWSAMFILVVMALGALCWAILKRVKRAVVVAIQNVRERSAKTAKSTK